MSMDTARVRPLGFVTAAVSLGICAALAPALAPVSAWASVLLAPAVGAADSATQGTRIADPQTPSAALFENPAGLTGFDTTTHGGGFGIGYGRGRIEASVPAGYKETNNVWSVMPDFGLSIPYRERWRFAIGSYGTTGSKFDFDADPALGVPGFFSETIVIAVPLGVAYRLSEHVSIGAELQPMFGQLRTHFPLGGLDFKYKINGPGVQGMVGMTVRPTEQWAFGLSVRTPGMIWMGGSMPVPGGARQRVDVDLEMPTQVFVGATWRCMTRLTLSGSVRFTDSSTLGDSTIEYELTPQANTGFLPYSKDEWKYALGAEYALRPQTALRVGASWASHIVGSKGVSPLAFDGDDAKIAIGAGQQFGPWTLDVMAGYALPAERHISPSTALVLPGTYSMQGAIFILGLTYRGQ
jgi:long-subunit fatty acid transport protein